MNQSKNIHDVSTLYFFILAFIYVAAALAFRNDLYPVIATLLMRILDIPFAFVALLYGGSTLYFQLNEKEDEGTSPWVMVIFAICILLFALVVFINFAFPSKI